MKPTCNHKSDWLVSFCILFYLLSSQVKSKVSSMLNSHVKSSERTYEESNGILICDGCCYFYYKRLKLLKRLRRRSKAANFSFRVGNLQSYCEQSNHFHQGAKDAFYNITKKQTGSESEAD